MARLTESAHIQAIRVVDRSAPDGDVAVLGIESHGRKRNIILVEDSDAVRKSLSLMLRTSGYDVQSYSSAEELLSSYPRMDDQFLVVDYVLPQMNGIDLVLALRGRGWAGPVILITGFYDASLPRKTSSVDIPTILEKPLDADNLLDALSKVEAQALQQDTQICDDVEREPKQCHGKR